MPETQNILIDAILTFKDDKENLQLIREWMSKTEIPEQIRVIFVHDVMFDHDCKSGVYELNSFFQEDRFILVEGKFGSPGASRNAGLDHTSADWIVFWDSDDVPNPRKYLEMVISGMKTESKLCVGGYETINLKSGKGFERLIRSSPLSIALSPGIWRMAFRSCTLVEKRFSESLWGEDQRFLFEIDLWNIPLYYFSDLVYRYSQGTSSQLTRKKRNVTYLVDELDACLEIFDCKTGTREILLYSVMNTRMLATLIKYGTLREIMRVLPLFMKTYLISPRKFFVGLFPSICLILFNFSAKARLKAQSR